MTYGLVLAGVPEENALAAVLLYRMSSFYLPPIWGYFTMKWWSVTTTCDVRRGG